MIRKNKMHSIKQKLFKLRTFHSIKTINNNNNNNSFIIMSFVLVYKELIWDTYLGELRIHATINNIPPIHFQFKLNYL